MGGEHIRFFYEYRRARDRLTDLALEGLHRLGVAPEEAQLQLVAGKWVHATSRDIRRAMDAAENINDSAARNRPGATLNVPEPTLRVRWPDSDN